MAATRSMQDAQQMAAQFFTSHPQGIRASQHGNALQHEWTALQSDGAPAFYVFNRGEEDGFIIVSAEDRARTILAYSDEGHFSQANIPVNVRAWLDEYCRTIHQVARTPRMNAASEQSAKTYTPVTKICMTRWGQDSPYNLLCPKINGQRTATGCVATAAAQIMKVYQHPTVGVGSHSYTWNDTVLSVDCENTTYQWSQMKNNYGSSSSTTQDQKNAVATLMYHCGVTCEMTYGLSSTGGSWAYFDYMMYALMRNFDYDWGVRVLLKDYMGEAAFLDSLSSEFQSGRPIYFSARTKNDEGHAFIGDGIDAEGRVHVNWGWDGNCDGYYRVSAMDPENQGTGGSSGNYAYTYRVCAYTHLHPNQGGKPRYTFNCAKMVIENERIKRNETPSIKLDTMENTSLFNWSGDRVLLIYKNGQLFDVCAQNNAGALGPYYYYYYFRICPSLAQIPEGDYTVVPALAVDEQPDVYEPIFALGKGICRFPMRVTADSILMGSAGPTPEWEALDNIPYEQKGQKYIENGQVLIERNGNRYDLLGTEVKREK